MTSSMDRLWPRLFCLAIALMLLCFLLSLSLGSSPMTLSQLLHWLLGTGDSQTKIIIEQLRLPRALLAMGIGALLAVCGTATQGLFRNPLADPSLIGVSAGATAGACLVIVLLSQFQWTTYIGLPLVSLGAFAGAMIVVVFVYQLATRSGITSVPTMLLAGLAFTFLAGSISSSLEFIADNEMLRRISLWRMGGLDASDYTQVWIIAITTTAVIACLYRQRLALNALLLGESEARHLGIDVAKVKTLIVISVAAGVGTAVAVAGTISFIGLIVPHMVRMYIGPDHRYLMPLTAVVGAIILVVADTIARTIIAPSEMPVGLLTAFIGAPVFISLLRRRHEYGM